MSTRNTPPEPETSTDRPGPLQRLGNALAWYTPELTVAAASAGAAATVWTPLGVISAACGARIATNQINLARANRQVLREVEHQRAERAQLDPNGEHDEPSGSSDDTTHDGDGSAEPGQTAEPSSAGEPPSAEQTGERPGWEVAG